MSRAITARFQWPTVEEGKCGKAEATLLRGRLFLLKHMTCGRERRSFEAGLLFSFLSLAVVFAAGRAARETFFQLGLLLVWLGNCEQDGWGHFCRAKNFVGTGGWGMFLAFSTALGIVSAI